MAAPCELFLRSKYRPDEANAKLYPGLKDLDDLCTEYNPDTDVARTARAFLDEHGWLGPFRAADVAEQLGKRNADAELNSFGANALLLHPHDCEGAIRDTVRARGFATTMRNLFGEFTMYNSEIFANPAFFSTMSPRNGYTVPFFRLGKWIGAMNQLPPKELRNVVHMYGIVGWRLVPEGEGCMACALLFPKVAVAITTALVGSLVYMVRLVSLIAPMARQLEDLPLQVDATMGVPWHTDNYDNVVMHSGDHYSVQFAISPSLPTKCLQGIDASHKNSPEKYGLRPMIPGPLTAKFAQRIMIPTATPPANRYDYVSHPNGTLSFALAPGEFVVFHNNLIHRGLNIAPVARNSLTCRIVPRADVTDFNPNHTHVCPSLLHCSQDGDMTTSEPAYPAPRFALPMGSDAQLTRIVYGTAALFTYPDPLVVLDAAYDAGITAFDCAAIYGLGMCETIVGHWMKVRNLARERVVLISKGGHPTIGLGRTRVDEECIRADLDASLTRLCVAYVDIYLLHRDDERVPVERVCEWMDRLVSGGKVKYWGVSNWTIGRIRQAVDYATHKGLVPPRYDSEHVSPMIPESTLYDGVPLIDPRNRVEELIPLNIRLLAWAPLAEGCCCHAQSLSKRHKRAYGGAVNTSIRHALIAIAVQRGDSMARCALAYTLACSEELCVVVGTGRVSHVYDTMLSITRPLDSAQCETIRKCFPYRAHRRPTPLEIPT